ncbi:hypothetical protein EJ04DRAFT_553368 [Polyplosphaeria fusca]|uniref:Uncharacterized protein n=1 Tax=Polyplosphaeria fusca TaxID=682080 RepID=A0A9P4QTE2_9PLEO|nr:hypothetical protein EJ04DRAFT_553368 [Polyplosphaeria fusca]
MQSTTPINYYDMGIVRGKHLLSRNADQISGREAIYTPLTGLRRMDHQFEPNFHELVNHVKSVSRRIQPYIDPQKRPAVINNVTYSTMLKFPEDNEDLVEGLIWFWLRKTCFRSPFSFGEPFSELTMATWKHLYGVLLQKTEPATTRSEIETRRLSLISEYKVFIHIKITETLTGFCMSPYPVTLSAEILRMVERALTLAIAMSLHRSRIQVMGQPFVVEPQRNGLRFAHLTPGLVKWGDEEGKQFKEGEWLVMPIGLNVFPDALHFHSPSVNGYSTSRAL